MRPPVQIIECVDSVGVFSPSRSSFLEKPTMSKTAQDIIEEAMRDRAIYDKMAARESEVWGKILPALQVSTAAAEEAAASQQLQVGRFSSSLSAQAKERQIVFERGVSLSCGAGRLERSLVTVGTCKSFHGIDISEGAVADARRAAAEASLPITYQAADLNFVELEPQAYDLVVAQTSLHHVLFLERVAFQAWRALKPGGLMWIHDFVGETQGQYQPKRLQIINELLALLPEKHRRNINNGRTVSEIKTPKPGTLGSPFEKIRSSDIVPVFTTMFDIEWKAEFTAFLDLVAPPGTRSSYAQNEDTRTLMELLLYMDQLCLREGLIQPVAGQYLLRPKPLPANSTFETIFPAAAALERGEKVGLKAPSAAWYSRIPPLASQVRSSVKKRLNSRAA